MAFLSSMVGLVAVQNKQAIAQACVLDKKTVKLLSDLVRDNTKRCWKPALGAFVVGTCVYGAIKIRSEILLARKELNVRPTFQEVRNLSHTALLVDGNCGPDLDVEVLDSLADDLFEELLEFEDYLEVDSAPNPERLWQDTDRRVEIIEESECVRRLDSSVAETSDEILAEKPKPSFKVETCRAVVAVKQQKVDYEEFRRARKRVRCGQLSKACKSLAAKLRASFPIPDGSSLQQKAMCLYAAKECRKLHLRESQIAQIIPQAVSLASVPSTDQINMRMITKIEPVQLKYNKMAWSGYQSKSSWLAKLTSILA